MGESTCIVNSFSYASGMPNEPANHGNDVHALGDSVSFGRFVSESLAWEKWSTFTNKRYVEEAKSYAQPGSVAQKKAFFEAHYKRIAAQKAAAAALLEQEKATATTTTRPKCQVKERVCATSQTTHDSEAMVVLNTHDSPKRTSNSRDSPTVVLKSDEEQQIMIMTDPAAIPLISRKPSRIPPAPPKYVTSVHPAKENIAALRTKNSAMVDSIDKKRPTPRSLYVLMNSRSGREPFKIISPAIRNIEITKDDPSAHTMSKSYATPTLTPTKAFTEDGVNKQPLAMPSSAKRRMETPVHPSAAGSKTAGPKWHILSAVSKSLSAYRNKLRSPATSSPFILRTGEQAARRKQKLKEKFNEKERKVQLQTILKEKAGTNFVRLRQSFCFKAQPLSGSYKERETSLKNQTKKTPKKNPKSMTPRRKPPLTISRPSPTSSTKIKSSRRLWKNNDQNPTHQPLFSLPKMINHDNPSTNIQH